MLVPFVVVPRTPDSDETIFVDARPRAASRQGALTDVWFDFAVELQRARPKWQIDALCRGDETWFIAPFASEKLDLDVVARQIETCLRCPVIAECKASQYVSIAHRPRGVVAAEYIGPTGRPTVERKTCVEDDCDRDATSKGRCGWHYVKRLRQQRKAAA